MYVHIQTDPESWTTRLLDEAGNLAVALFNAEMFGGTRCKVSKAVDSL
jgi:hypothetical protein